MVRDHYYQRSICPGAQGGKHRRSLIIQRFRKLPSEGLKLRFNLVGQAQLERLFTTAKVVQRDICAEMRRPSRRIRAPTRKSNTHFRNRTTDIFDLDSSPGFLGQIANEILLTRYMTRLLEKKNRLFKEAAELPEHRARFLT